MKNFTKGLISTLATIVVVSGFVYAANTIASVTTQTIGQGDTMGVGWFQDVNNAVLKIGTITAGKWCTSDGSKMNCTSDAPTTAPVAPPGTVTYGGIAWQTTDTGPKNYSEAAIYCNTLAPVGTWRIPTSSEMEFARVLGMPFTTARFFWSSTPYLSPVIYNRYYNLFYTYSPTLGWNYCYRTYSAYCTDYDGPDYLYNYPLYIRCVKNL